MRTEKRLRTSRFLLRVTTNRNPTEALQVFIKGSAKIFQGFGQGIG